MSADVSKTEEAPLLQKSTADASDTILEALVSDTVLIGTMRTLAGSLGVTMTALRASLRSLLETEQIVVRAGPKGQLTIRRGPYVSSPLPALAPPSLRRGVEPRAWIM